MSDLGGQMGDGKATNPDSSAKEERYIEIGPKYGEYPKDVRLALIVTVLMLSVFLASLDITIVAIAIPKIIDEFHDLDKASWYGSAFFLTSGSFQASWGKAYKYLDIKWTFLSAIVIFELGSLLCAVAPNSNALIVGRAIAGVGTAGMGTGGYIIIAYVVEPVKRPTYAGFVGLSYCLASVVGPLVEGAITTAATSARFVTVLIVLFFFRTPSIAEPITATWMEGFLEADFVGVALILGALVSYSLATQYGGQTKAWNSSTVIGLLVGFVLLVCIFAAWEWHAGEWAMIVPRLLKQQQVATGSLFAFFSAGSYFLIIYYLPVYFQSVDGASPINSGVDTLPLIIAAAAAVLSAGLFITKTGYAVPVQVASAIIATVGAGLLFTLNLSTPTGNWIGYQIIAALGWGAGFQIPVIICQALAKPEDIPSLTAIILCEYYHNAILTVREMYFNFFHEVFLNAGGGLLINGAQSALVNTLISTLPTSAPDVDSFLLVSTGVLEIRSVFPEEQIPGILVAYMKEIRVVLAIGLTAGGISFIVSLLGGWRKQNAKARKGAGAVV
ncbi:major facilitator superfamily domain-containing protein [Xylaria digitata]|nr:major facilitator superfamily domain-containing protein [Xylaria digitata]